MTTTALSVSEIGQCIHHVRGNQVILDSDLAKFYQVGTKNLNKAVGRNLDRFPEDFMFQLIQSEYDSLRFQSGTLKAGRGEHRKYLPFVFTEQGAAAVSSILKSERAVRLNIAIMRAFAQFRHSSGGYQELKVELKRVKNSLDEFRQKYDEQSALILEVIRPFRTSEPIKKLDCTDLVMRNPHQCGIEAIQKSVAMYFGLKLQELKGTSRSGTCAIARQIGMYLVREKLGLSFREIGTYFGRKDHTTVLHAYRKIRAEVEKNSDTRFILESIDQHLATRLA